MESGLYDKAKKTMETIVEKKERLNKVERLLKCCGLVCNISGTPSNQFIRTPDYKITNKEDIKKLLENDMQNLKYEIKELERNFNDL